MAYLEVCHLQGLGAESENDNSKCPGVSAGDWYGCVCELLGQAIPHRWECHRAHRGGWETTCLPKQRIDL